MFLIVGYNAGMNCPNCGHAVPDTATICPICFKAIGGTQHLPTNQGAFDKFSDSLQGYINTICDWLGVAQQRTQAHVAAAPQRAAARQQQLLAQDSGMGACPQCGSHSIRQFNTKSGGDSSAQMGACCIGGCFFWPLLLLAPFLGRSGTTTTHRRCNACGHQWVV